MMATPDWHRAFVGIGANLNDPESGVRRAIVCLRGIADTQLIACSSLYRTAPVGYLEQPDFVNAVAELQTRLQPQALLDQLLRIENQFGRKRSRRNAPRTLDLDLLLYEDRRSRSESLTLPHPRMSERAFVLVPLAEIAPEVMVGDLGTASQLLQAVGTDGVTCLGRLGETSQTDVV